MAAHRPYLDRGIPAERTGVPAFTLVELLVAMAVLLAVMVVLLQLTAEMGKIWTSSSGKISAFQNARSAFTTINQAISRTTLNTYNDYVDANGNYRTPATTSTFTPAEFARASELHFISGPASVLVPGGQGANNPGHVACFSAPLGVTNLSGSYSCLTQSLNSVAFYTQYGKPDEGLIPNWLTRFIAGNANRFRILEFIEPTENVQIYNSTSRPTYDLQWLRFCQTPLVSGQPPVRILAEDVLLLVLRPRLSLTGEQTLADSFGVTYNSAQAGSILCPDYNYDSRAWQDGYPGTIDSKRKQVMRNQVPPIVDVAMVCADRLSLARFAKNSSTLPPELLVPSQLFTDSAQMEGDLTTYAQQLTDAHVRFHILRNSVQLQTAKWSNK